MLQHVVCMHLNKTIVSGSYIYRGLYGLVSFLTDLKCYCIVDGTIIMEVSKVGYTFAVLNPYTENKIIIKK